MSVKDTSLNPTIESILNRRSIRSYTGEPVDDASITAVLEAGRWAPSGLNNQPWRFVIIRDAGVRGELAALTKYGRIVRECDICIAVFFHAPSGYNRDKDLMGMGACVQNMLLAAHSLGLGAVWLGEILKSREEVGSLLGIDAGHELVAVVALGHPAERPKSKRAALDSLILKKI